GAHSAVKTLDQAPLAANIQPFQVFKPGGGRIMPQGLQLFGQACQWVVLFIRTGYLYRCLLPYSICIDEITAEVDNGPASPAHPQPVGIGYNGHLGGL